MRDEQIIPSFPDGKDFTDFKNRHPAVLRALDEMAVGFTGLMGLIKEQKLSEVNTILFLLFGASWREFEEILVLAMNGYGSGAMKLLRALYERTVTTQYLMKSPNKVRQFSDFSHVHWHKLLTDADQTGVAAELSKQRRDEIEANFAKVKDEFTEIACKPCKKTRLQGSWTKKPVPTQAREIHEQLGQICFQGYLMPTFFLHTTLWGITQQMKEHPNGTVELHNVSVESHYASRAIIFGATLMTHLADATSRFFSLGDAERKAIEHAVGIITQELIGPVGAEMTASGAITSSTSIAGTHLAFHLFPGQPRSRVFQ